MNHSSNTYAETVHVENKQGSKCFQTGNEHFLLVKIIAGSLVGPTSNIIKISFSQLIYVYNTLQFFFSLNMGMVINMIYSISYVPSFNTVYTVIFVMI